MKLFFLSIVFSAILSWFFSWNAFVFVTAIMGMASRNSWRAFLCGFCSIFVLWCGSSLVLHLLGDGVLAPRLGAIFNLPAWPLIFILSGLAGGLIGGLSAWAGYNFQDLVRSGQKK